ncbi:hypothetical protein ACLB2K_065846 [Fragaria x ananassa]
MCYEPTSLDPKSNTSGFNKKYWKKQNLDFISQVEEVTIELSAGSNGIEFARYVLEHAKSLEKMVIRIWIYEDEAHPLWIIYNSLEFGEEDCS